MLLNSRMPDFSSRAGVLSRTSSAVSKRNFQGASKLKFEAILRDLGREASEKDGTTRAIGVGR